MSFPPSVLSPSLRPPLHLSLPLSLPCLSLGLCVCCVSTRARAGKEGESEGSKEEEEEEEEEAREGSKEEEEEEEEEARRHLRASHALPRLLPHSSTRALVEGSGRGRAVEQWRRGAPSTRPPPH